MLLTRYVAMALATVSEIPADTAKIADIVKTAAACFR